MLVHSLSRDAMLPLIQVRLLGTNTLHIQSTEKLDITTLESIISNYTERSYGASCDLQVAMWIYHIIKSDIATLATYTNKSLADSGKTYLIMALDVENQRLEYICKNGAIKKLDINIT